MESVRAVKGAHCHGFNVYLSVLEGVVVVVGGGYPLWCATAEIGRLSVTTL